MKWAPNYSGAKKGASFLRMYLGENLRISVAANQGGRKYMEDRVHIETIRNEDGSLKFTFFGIFDGHGGHEASEYVRKNLLNNIMKSDLLDSDDDDDVLVAIRSGFLSTHHGIWKIVSEWPRTASGYPSMAGTTVSVAIVRKGRLFTGHVGDSAIILLKRSYLPDNSRDLVPQKLTVDHKPESEEEQARIRRAGGSVALKNGVARVVWTRPMKQHTGPVRRSTSTEGIPYLAVARSLGDVWSYCEDTQEFVVSPEPDLAVREITGDDICLVLASDGLTNVLRPVQVAAIVDKEENVSQIGVDRYEDLVYRDKHTNLARVLVANAIRNWRHLRADNVTAITVMFDSPYADLPVDHPCVEEYIGNKCSIDKVFVDDPECMVRVSPSAALKLYTYRTPIVYKGARDPHFSVVEYTGPGFMTHTEELLLEERYCKAYQEAQQDNGSSNKLELEFSTTDCKKFDVNVVATRNPGSHEEERVAVTSETGSPPSKKYRIGDDVDETHENDSEKISLGPTTSLEASESDTSMRPQSSCQVIEQGPPTDQGSFVQEQGQHLNYPDSHSVSRNAAESSCDSPYYMLSSPGCSQYTTVSNDVGANFVNQGVGPIMGSGDTGLYANQSYPLPPQLMPYPLDYSVHMSGGPKNAYVPPVEAFLLDSSQGFSGAELEDLGDLTSFFDTGLYANQSYPLPPQLMPYPLDYSVHMSGGPNNAYVPPVDAFLLDSSQGSSGAESEDLDDLTSFFGNVCEGSWQ